MKNKLLMIVLAIFLIAPIVSFKDMNATAKSQSFKWWSLAWNYRIKVEVYSGNFARVDEPVELTVDFVSLFRRWGISGTLDKNSIRVIEQTDSTREVLSQFDPTSGEIIWLAGSMDAGRSTTYYIYFDILENGPKSPPSYYDSMANGGILVFPMGSYISVVYKIGDLEYEVARIDETYGGIYYFKPPFGESLIEDEGSLLGLFKKGDMSKGKVVSITGGPVRYKIKFSNELGAPDAPVALSDYSYTFYYVPNGDEVRTKLNLTWIAFQGFVPQNHIGEGPAAIGIQEVNTGCLHTAYLATDMDAATLYDIPSTWGSMDGDVNSSLGLSDNFWGAYGESGGIGIIPISPDYSNWFVDGQRDRSGWNWSAYERSLANFIDRGTHEWIFWIHGYAGGRWDLTKDLGNRLEEPLTGKISIDRSLTPAPGSNQPAQIETLFNHIDPSFYDLEDKFFRDRPEKNNLDEAWLSSGWEYRKSHSISGSPVGLLTDYAVRIVVHYGSGIDSGEDVYLSQNCRTDFGDVRFSRSDGSTQLDYWIEERTDSDNAVFWVEVNSIPASPSSATIYIYYGNNTATTTSNGKNTFEWFDDFVIDSSIDYDIGRHTSIWHGAGVYNPYYDAVNRRVAYDTDDNFSGGWMVRSSNLTIQNFAAKVTFGVTGSYPINTTNGILGRWTGNSAYYGFYVAGGVYTAPALVRDARTTIIEPPPTDTYHPFNGIPHTLELRIYGNNLTGIYNEGEVVLNGTDSTHLGAGQVEVIVAQATGWFDFFFVRKYVEPEPSHGPWGGEEGLPAYFRVTGSSSMTAGGSNELTITAYSSNDNIATSYTGSQGLIFSGLSAAPNGTMPTVEGTDVGAATYINFTNGVSDAGAATLIAYVAETTEVDVTDGTIDSFANPSYDLDLTVNPGPASNLNFNQQPTDTVASSHITPAVTVELRDQWNNLCTNDHTTIVSVTINNNPGGGTLSGTTSRTTSNGVATFSDLSIDKAGSGYTLDATFADMATIISNAFNITAGPASRIRIEDNADGTGSEVDTRTISAGESFTVYTISRDANNNFVANVVVTWSLINKTGGVVDSDLVPSGDNKSAIFTGHAGGKARIKASHATLGDDTTGDITITNQPPVALFEFEPKTGFVPCQIRFDASNSYDPDGHIVSYEWDFGDGSKGSGVNTHHTYTYKGEFLVTLKVTDANGSTDTVTAQVEILDIYPPINVALISEINRSLFKKEVFHTVSWSPNPENSSLTIISYRIYRKEAEDGQGGYQLVGTVSGNTFVYVDGYLDIARKLIYAVTSVESSGHESKKSVLVKN